MKVFVGLSGGVDSAVAAYLLKQEGHDVVGVFIKGWEPDFLPCTGAEDRLSAMRVAAHLEIPFKTYDLSEEYKKSVVDYFVAEYEAGRTPNPDVMCNRTIKFGAMWERAKAEGADAIATGHYAQRKVTADSLQLTASEDNEKDQTYFLWTLTQDDLEHVLFPIGKYKKSEVRRIAEGAKLPNAKRRDSQGLCFLGHVDMHQFLKRYLPTTPGPILNVSGEQVGEHDGAWFYTLGQHVSTSGTKRLYVVGKEVSKNELTVSDSAQNYGHRTSIGMKKYDLMNVSWVGGSAPRGPVVAQYRYHGEFVSVTLTEDGVLFQKPVLVAPGQSVVFYDRHEEVCFGGGIIAE